MLPDKPYPNESLDPNETRTSETRGESQVFSYTAPWLIYSLGFSSKPNQLYKIAVGSFLEEKENQVFKIFSLIFHFSGSFSG